MQNKILLINLCLKIIILSIVISSFVSCKKYLDAKPDSKLLVPSTTEDLIKMLDTDFALNEVSSRSGDFCSESFYYTEDIFDLIPEASKYGYTWDNKMFSQAGNAIDWQGAYNVVYYANVVLEQLLQIEKAGNNFYDWNYCKGAALTFRAKSFYEIAQIWTKAYDSTTANTDLGIPLRLNSDFNKSTSRANLKETYDQIINDLQDAIPLLPVSQIHPFRPTKPAAYGLLAKTYLAMRDYSKAGLYADSCLQLRTDLLDYNTIDASINFPFQHVVFDNPEDIMHSILGGMVLDSYGTLIYYVNIDTSFYNSYHDNDLRKSLLYKPRGDGSYYYDGMYGYSFGYGRLYNGITNAEMLLIKAEVLARKGIHETAMQTLNSLLEKRWKLGTFIPFTAASPEIALEIILEERHKELFCRGVRFTDIKRLNKEGKAITLTRSIKGKTYTLPPNDPRYALPIPEQVILLTGIPQN